MCTNQASEQQRDDHGLTQLIGSGGYTPTGNPHNHHCAYESTQQPSLRTQTHPITVTLCEVTGSRIHNHHYCQFVEKMTSAELHSCG